MTLDNQAVPAVPSSVSVIGSGTMGAGIALCFAIGGSKVRVMTRTDVSVLRVQQRIASSLEFLRDYNLLSDVQTEEVQERIEPTNTLQDCVRESDLVIESIPERLTDKQQLFHEADVIAHDQTILTTNTSSLSIDAIAQSVQRSDRFAGLHWFNPPEFVELVEVIAAQNTSPETITLLSTWMEAVGKVVVGASNTPGFIANRLQYALLREAFALVDEGVCTYSDVDKAVRAGLGARWAAVGPFESLDLAGLDVHLAVSKQLYPLLSTATTPSSRIEELIATGSLGVKSGSGIYGTYTTQQIEGIVRRRNSILVMLAQFRGIPGGDISVENTRG